MSTPRLPITGFPHLFLAAQDNDVLHTRTVAALKKGGFRIEAGRLVPPEGVDGRFVIRAIADAFHMAKAN